MRAKVWEWGVAAVLAATCAVGSAQDAVTKVDLAALISQPFASELTPAPLGHRFAWVEDAASRQNIWVGGPGETARNLTGFTADDGLHTGELAWSHDGMLIAFVRSTPYGTDGKAANPAHNPVPNDPAVWIAGDGRPPLQMGLGHAPKFLPDGRLLYLRGGTLWQTSISPSHAEAADFPSRPLIERGGYGSASSLTLSPDRKRLAFLTSRDGAKQVAIYDLEQHTLRFPAPGFGRALGLAWSPDGTRLAYYRAPGDAAEFATDRVRSTPWSLDVLDVASGLERTIYRPAANEPGSVLAQPDNNDPTLAWTADGRLMFFAELQGWIGLFATDPAHPETPPTRLTATGGEVDRISLSPDRTRLLVVDNLGATAVCAPNPNLLVDCDDRMDAHAIDGRRLEATDLSGERAAAKTLDLPEPQEAHVVVSPAWSADGLYRAALVSGPRTPLHPVWIAREGSYEFDPVSDTVGLPRTTLAAPEQAIFSTTGETGQLHGQLFLPPASFSGRRPAVIFFHGGPRRQMQLAYPSGSYYAKDYAFNQYLASLGFVVLSVNYRSGLGYGLNFRQCEGCGAAGAAEYADVLAAQRYLAGRADVDGKRVGLWGGSYGGYLTAMGLARNSDLFAAGVDISGVHEWILERNRGDWLVGSPAQKAAIAAKAHASSPMAAIDGWRSPVLLIHGDLDPDVNFAQTTTLAAALRARQVPVETLVLPGETHNFLLHRDWMAAFEASAEFFVSRLHPER